MRPLFVLLLFALPLAGDAPVVTEHRNGVPVETEIRIKVESPGPKAAVTLPAEVRVKVGQLLRIEADAAVEVTWDFPDSLAAEGEFEILGRKLILPSAKPGTWIVRAWICEGAKAVKSNPCRVIIEGTVPPEPGPGPDPGPDPVPSDLKAQLAEAIKRDGGGDGVKYLVSVLKLAVDETAKHATTGKFLDVITNALELAVDRTLAATRGVIGEELRKRFPAAETPLDLANRTLVVRVLRETAVVLESIGPGPQPVPPGPVPPSPTLEADLASAFAQDVATGGGTVEDKVAMASVYREGVNWLPQVGTLAEFAGELGKLNKAKLGSRLPQTRKVVGAYLNKVLPTDPNAKFDGALKAKLAAAFKSIADALGRIGRTEQRRAA